VTNSAGERIGPTIVVCVADAARAADPGLAARKNELYAAAIRRHGGDPLLIDAATPRDARRRAFETMAGLLLSGGADLDPTRYAGHAGGSEAVQRDRDAMEAEAWSAARDRSLPVLGICRGLQAVNVFSGGGLLQHVNGHLGEPYGNGSPMVHPLRLVPGTRLARILSPTNVRGGVVSVNSYHHQAVRAQDLAPGLIASGYAASPEGQLVEALESTAGPLVLAVQCHPERRESTPVAFERLFRVFVDACRGAVGARVPG
jgi:putative glutamine amidotransferase